MVRGCQQCGLAHHRNPKIDPTDNAETIRPTSLPQTRETQAPNCRENFGSDSSYRSGSALLLLALSLCLSLSSPALAITIPRILVKRFAAGKVLQETLALMLGNTFILGTEGWRSAASCQRLICGWEQKTLNVLGAERGLLRFLGRPAVCLSISSVSNGTRWKEGKAHSQLSAHHREQDTPLQLSMRKRTGSFAPCPPPSCALPHPCLCLLWLHGCHDN